MTATKAQERKALEQIKEIVAKLGEDSYIATAFEGCFEMAEQNIDNDWAFSPKHKINCLESQMAELKDDVDMWTAKCSERGKALDRVQEDCNYWREHCKETQDAYIKEKTCKEVLQDKIKEKDQKIIELKAMLFDYMIKEVE